MNFSRSAVTGLCLFVCFFIGSFTGSTVCFIAAVCLVLCAVTLQFTIKNKDAVFAIAAASASFLIFGIYSLVFIEPTALLAGMSCELTAAVTSVSRTSHGSVYITAESAVDGVPVKFSFYYPDADITPGSTVEGSFTFSGLPGSDILTSAYNYSRGIFLRADAEMITDTVPGRIPFVSEITDYSAYLREKISDELDGDERGLLLAMFFGDKSGLTGKMSAAIRKCGLSHITAVSGMHLSLIVISTMTLLGLLPFGKNRWFRFAASVTLIAVFMVFFNMTASVRRSGIMMIFLYGGRLFRRRYSVPSSLGAAAALILLCEPYACRDMGLILSVCGTVGAGIASPALCRLIEKHRKLSDPARAVITCVCAAYCCIPASSVIFGGFSLLSPITYLFIYPFFTASMILTLLFAVTGGLLGEFLIAPAGVVLKPVTAMFDAVFGLRYGMMTADSEFFIPFCAVSGLFVLVIIILALRSKLSARHILYSLAAVFCAAAGATAADKLTDSDTAHITVYSDGRDHLAAVSYRSGVSLFVSGVSEKLSDYAYTVMTDMNTDHFDLICVFADKKYSSVYSEAFAEIPAEARQFMDNTENIYDIGDKYTVTVYEDAAETEIAGVSVIMCETAAAPIYGGHDIAIYSGFKRSESYDINNVTVLSDKRYHEPKNAYSAYERTVKISIFPDGSILVGGR